MTWKLIWAFCYFRTESKTMRDEQWPGSWYGHSVTRVLRGFTLSPRVTECPYQLPSNCSSLSVLLSVHNSLNAHINFPVIVRLSLFYSQYTSHWMPISTSRSLFVSHRFTLCPEVTECPYQLSDSWTESKTERDEKWLGSWYGHSVTGGLRVKRRKTNNDLEVDMGIQWLIEWE
jgi:hypothetical protein